MDLARLQGVIPAMATPLADDEHVDEQGLRRLVRTMLEGGVDGILVLGTAGEGPLLDSKARYRAIELTVDEVAGKVPVLVGTGDLTTARAKENNRVAASLGADAALAVPPFYFPLPATAVIDYYRDLAGEGTIPVMIYNIPSLTKVRITMDMVEALSREPGVAGIKDSAGDMIEFLRMLKLRSDKFKVFQGRAPLNLVSLMAGADGLITPVANVAPACEARLLEAYRAGDLDDARKWQDQATAVAGLFAYGNGPIATGLKACVFLAGLGEYRPAKPNPRLAEGELEALRRKMRSLGLLP